jgi:iron complex transport system permease protein
MMDKLREKKIFYITLLFTCVVFFVSLRVGRYPISTGEIFAILFGGEVDPMTQAVFLRLRLPRTVMALIAGAGLGMAGSVFQLVFKNPLAAPEIVGVSSGANLGAALAIVFLGNPAAFLAPSAFLGGMLVLLLVVSLARMSRNNNTVTFILAGIIMKAVSDACIMTLKFFADPEKELAAMEYWAMGSLGGITASKLLPVLPFFLVGFTGLLILQRQITLLGLEDDESRTLGVRVKLIRVVVLGFAALTVASIVCQTGLIAFAGLIAPHVARLALKRVSFNWCFLSAITGAFILLISDCLARGISYVEIPISIPTTFIGVPILLYFMWNRKTGKI